MSVQFGRWNFGGRPLPPEEIEAVQRMMAGYGAGAGRTFGDLGISIVHQPFCTSRDSHREVQPYVASSGKVFVWDGRLDNRATYLELLTDRLAPNSPDVSIVAAAYERWGTGCLAQLVGDWALSVWDPKERFLILAKDPIGVRPVSYTHLDVYKRQIDSFMSQMSALMAAQAKQEPRPLSQNELDILALRLKAACSLLQHAGLPDTLGTLDCNPGNILVHRERCVFLDWADACVSNPLITYEHFKEHFRRHCLNEPEAIKHFAAAYFGPWEAVVSREDVYKRQA